MKKQNKGIIDLLNQTISDVEKGKIAGKIQIKESLERFKHERFIHLLVTTFVGLFLAILLTSNSNSSFIQILNIILIILEGCYLYHYCKLENGVQKLNQLYIQLLQKETK